MKIKSIKHTDVDTQLARIDRHSWSVKRLIALSSELEVMIIPLAHLNVYNSMEKMTLREMAGHVEAVNSADMSHPIILDEDGDIMDGRHRIIKAIVTGAETIKAVRFAVNPEPCRIEESE
jgi:hypothetical protein